MLVLVFMQTYTGVNSVSIFPFLSWHFTLNHMFLLLNSRFLIFPDMGCSLQSVLEEENELLSEKAVLQLACRIVSVILLGRNGLLCSQENIFFCKMWHVGSFQLDVLEFIHSKEYVHADVNAENIYVKPGQKSQVKQSVSVGNLTLWYLWVTKPNK